MAIISLGRIDKKLYLLLILIIIRQIYKIVMKNTPDNYHNFVLDALGEDVGYIIAGIIIKFSFKLKQKKKEKNKRSFKYLTILFFLEAIKSSYEYIYHYATDYEPFYEYYAILNATNGVEIILMSYATFLLFKYKYYIHHIITMIIYCILCIIIDLILGNFTKIGYNYVYFFIIFIINEILIFCYLKYMMDKLYYPIGEIILYFGIFGLIIQIFIFIGIALYEYKNDIDGILYGLEIYLKETNIFVIIFFSIYILIDGALYCILLILILFYLKPNYLIVDDEINNYSKDMYKDNSNKLYTIIPFVLQILVMLFYFEILEFNVCNLNKNTAKNIEIRERNERKLRLSEESAIELNGEYYVNEEEFEDNDDDKENNLNEKNEEFNFNKESPLMEEFEMKNN